VQTVKERERKLSGNAFAQVRRIDDSAISILKVILIDSKSHSEKVQIKRLRAVVISCYCNAECHLVGCAYHLR